MTAVAANPLLPPGPLAEALRRHREEFNARFILAQRSGGGGGGGGGRIEAAVFLQFLAAVVDPILRPIADAFAERADAAAVALYELSLELFAASLLGPQARHGAVAGVWQRVLPAIPRLLAREPRRIAASLSNAAHNLAQTSGARPAQWLDAMAALAPNCGDAALLLDLGKIAAWQAGCPHYRYSALETARAMQPQALVPLLFPNAAPADVTRALAVLTAYRWLTPAEALAGVDLDRLRIRQNAGAFRGFGGPFIRPPTVATQGPQLVVSDGEFIWSLIADAAGCIFQRLAAGTLPAKKQIGITRLSLAGSVHWETAGGDFPELAGFTSAAFDGQTLAITLPDSHHVFLLGRG